MITFLLGLVLGAAALFAVLIFGSRRNPRLRASVSGLLNGGQESTVPLSLAAVRDVEENDPEFAAVIESAPAVPVDSVPEEVGQPAQQAIEQAQTPEAALEVAKRFIRDPDVARAIVCLVRWRTRRNNSESQYQNSFRTYANKSGYAGQLAEKQRIPWGGGGGNRIAIPDLLLGDRVLVELKADLEASGDTDRAMGQMLRYLLAWKGKGPAVLAVCGKVSPEIRFLVRMYIDTWRRQLNLPVTVFFKQDGDESPAEANMEMPTEAPKLERVD